MTSLEKSVKAEAKAAAKSMLRHPERGALVYSEKKNKKARRVRLMHLASSGITAAALAGMALVVVYMAFFTVSFPLYVHVVGGVLAGVCLYWAVLSAGDLLKRKKALKHLKVYDLGLRLPMGTERDVLRGKAPRYIPFDKIAVFYPNEGKIEFPYFVVHRKDLEAPPIFVWKELIGDWGRFRKSVKGKMAVHKGWYFLEGEGPAFGGYVESDDLRLIYGDKENPSKLSWDAIEEEPKAQMKGLRNLAVVTVNLRKGGKLKFLVPLGASDKIARNYKKYIDRFWKEPEKEEERWEGMEEVVEKGDVDEDKED